MHFPDCHPLAISRSYGSTAFGEVLCSCSYHRSGGSQSHQNKLPSRRIHLISRYLRFIIADVLTFILRSLFIYGYLQVKLKIAIYFKLILQALLTSIQYSYTLKYFTTRTFLVLYISSVLAFPVQSSPLNPGVSNTAYSNDDSPNFDQLKELVNLVNERSTVSISVCDGKPSSELDKNFPVLKQLLDEKILERHYAQANNSSLSFANFFSNIMRKYLETNSDLEDANSFPEAKSILQGIVASQSDLFGCGVCINNKVTYSFPKYIPRDCQSFTGNQSRLGSASKLTLSDSRWLKVLCIPNGGQIFVIRKEFPLLLKNNSNIRGSIFFDFNLRKFRLNQCLTRLNRCKLATTKCVYEGVTKSAFDLGNYRCQCRETFYLQAENQYFNGTYVEAIFNISEDNSKLNCLACQPGCNNCTSNKPCVVQYQFRLLRGIPLAVQSFCITMCLVAMGFIFKIRRSRVIKNSNWILLEIFLVGAILLYSTIVIMYFQPNTVFCTLVSWLREIGFAVTYGTLLVKVYRVLSGFQSRKAHRVHVRDKDMLKYLGGFILLAAGYMSAWTAVNMDHHLGTAKSPLIEIGTIQGGITMVVCRAKYWDVVVEIIEFVILCLCIYYCHCVRSAPSEYREMHFITVAMINETVISAIVHIIRHFVWYRIHPDYVYLLYFIRCHATVSVTVIIIIVPKLWYIHRPPGGPGRSRPIDVPASKLNPAINGDIDIGEINLADMDPEDIRRELKRLYTQIEIYKTKAMRKDNPHVSKRRGGRKQRRFSLQPFYKKHLPSPSVQEEEPSKLSEDSTNSGDEHQNATKSMV